MAKAVLRIISRRTAPSAWNADTKSGRKSAAVTRTVSAMAWMILVSPILRALSQMLDPRVRLAAQA